MATTIIASPHPENPDQTLYLMEVSGKPAKYSQKVPISREALNLLVGPFQLFFWGQNACHKFFGWVPHEEADMSERLGPEGKGGRLLNERTLKGRGGRA